MSQYLSWCYMISLLVVILFVIDTTNSLSSHLINGMDHPPLICLHQYHQNVSLSLNWDVVGLIIMYPFMLIVLYSLLIFVSFHSHPCYAKFGWCNLGPVHFKSEFSLWSPQQPSYLCALLRSRATSAIPSLVTVFNEWSHITSLCAPQSVSFLDFFYYGVFLFLNTLSHAHIFPLFMNPRTMHPILCLLPLNTLLETRSNTLPMLMICCWWEQCVLLIDTTWIYIPK